MVLRQFLHLGNLIFLVLGVSLAQVSTAEPTHVIVLNHSSPAPNHFYDSNYHFDGAKRIGNVQVVEVVIQILARGRWLQIIVETGAVTSD